MGTFCVLDALKHTHSQMKLQTSAKRHTRIYICESQRTQREKNALHGNDKYQIQQDVYPYSEKEGTGQGAGLLFYL